MLRDDAVALIQRTCGYRSDQAANIISAMKLAQTQLELDSEKPWFLVSETLTRNMQIGEQRVLVPVDMLIEYDDASLNYVYEDDDGNTRKRELKKDELDVLQENYKCSAPGTPRAYALRGQYFIVFPTPDAEYTLEIVDYEQDDDLSSNVENKWLKYVPLLLIGKAGQYLAPGLRDPGALATFKDWEMQGKTALVRMNNERELSNRELQIGGPH